MNRQDRPFPTDQAIGFAALLLFALLEAGLFVSDSTVEPDLYRWSFGLLDGVVSKTGMHDPMHYFASISFGFIMAVYAFAGQAALHHPAELISFLNYVGYGAALLALCFMWLAVAAAYDWTIATAALIIFAFSPLFITVGAEGHPVLLAYMFFMAGAALIFRQSTGWMRMFLLCVAVALLTVAICIRADVALALPWIALTQRQPVSCAGYIKKVAATGAFLAIALLGFLLLHYLVDHALLAREPSGHWKTVSDVIREFFDFHQIINGAISAALGCGIATMLCLVAVSVAGVRRRPDLLRVTPLLAGPLALMIIALCCWLPIGTNSRHFITFLFGGAVFIPLVLSSELKWSRMSVIAAAVAVVVANQLLAEATRPVILRLYHFEYTSIPDERRTLTTSPLGFTWNHVSTLKKRHEIYARWFPVLAQLCDAKTVVLMDYDDTEQAIVSLYEGEPPRVDTLSVDGFKRVVRMVKRGRTLVFIVKAESWPVDPLARVLKEPQLTEYKILVDPYSLSLYDHAQVPPERAARTGCHVNIP